MTHPSFNLCIFYIQQGNLEEVQRLIREGLPIDSQDRMGSTLLYYAALNIQEDIVRFLLVNGANPNLLGSLGESPLYAATQNAVSELSDQNRAINIIELLFQSGADVNQIDPTGNPLFIHTLITARKEYELLLLFIRYGVNIHAYIESQNKPELKNKSRGEKMVAAVFNNDFLNSLYQLLHVAASNPQQKNGIILEIGRLLRPSIGDSSNSSGSGGGGCKTASTGSNRRTIHCVHPDRGRDTGWTPLHTAVLFNRPDRVQSLLETGANVNARAEFDGTTPLHQAIIFNRPDIVRILLENGANKNVNAQDSNGRTPLHHAVLINRPDLVHILLENGANVNTQDRNDQTPLHIAAIFGYADIIRMFAPPEGQRKKKGGKRKTKRNMKRKLRTRKL